MAVHRLTGRPELLLVLGLVVGCALLPSGLPLGIAGLGVVSGCVLGLHAIGIVLLYSRTRILSFAQFGLGAAASVFFFLFIQYNQFAVLGEGLCRCLAPDGVGLSDLQHRPDVFRIYLTEHGKSWVLAVNVVIAALLCIGMAATTGRQVFQGITAMFYRAPRIVPTVATLALAVWLGAAAGIFTMRNTSFFGIHIFAWLPWGPEPGTGVKGKPAIPEGIFDMPHKNAMTFTLSGGARFHIYEVLAVVLTLLALVYVTRRFKVGRRGLLSRATASDIERAASLGVDVVSESVGPWRVAGALSGLAAVLGLSQSAAAPAVGLDVGALTLVLASVVLARMTSPGIALLSSVALAVLDQGMFWNFHSHVQFQGGLILLIAAALLLQRGRVSRAERASESIFTTAAEPLRVPDAIRNAVGVRGFLRGVSILVGVAILSYPVLTTPRQLSLGITIVGYAVLGLSLLVISGWAGQVSLGQLALAAVGGFVTAVAGGSWHVPLPFSLILGGLAAMVIAPLVGLPALRLPGPFVAIMTLALALAVPAVLLNGRLLGGALPKTLERPVLLGIDLDSDRYFYWMSLLVLAATVAIVLGLRRSRLRRALIATRDNQQAAASFGVDPIRIRMEGFAVAGFLAGIGGGLLAYANSGVSPDTFSATNSMILFLVVVIGGLAALSGPIFGAAVFGIGLLFGTVWVAFVNGFGTILVLATRPGGLASIVAGLRDATVRVIMHLQGHDLIKLADGSRIAIAERGAQAEVVPVRYRLVGDGFGPVEGTRLRSVEGVESSSTSGSTSSISSAAVSPSLVSEVESALAAVSCHRLDVAYGGAKAVSGVSLSVGFGEILAIVGLNGAGKTSLLRALAGMEPAAHGTVEIAGLDVTMWLPHLRAQIGLAYVAGGNAVLPTLTVRENLSVAAGSDSEISPALSRFPMLASRLDTAAGNLSGGEQQILSIAQAMLRHPKVLLIDELSMGLSPEAHAAVLGLIQELADSGSAVILVEQSISTAMDIADRAVFMESGRIRYQGPARSLREHPELFASIAFGASSGAVTGGGSELARAQRLHGERDVVLRVEDISAAYGDVTVVDNVSLEVAAGDVIGVLGPNGAGKTSLFDCLSGALGVSSGAVTLLDQDITKLSPHKRASLGLMRSFQSVQLFPSLTVRDCIAVALETRLTVRSAAFAGLWLPPARAEERRVAERVDSLLELLSLHAVADQQVGSLSLGQRRMVDLACQLAARPKVLLLDEPAAGLAHGETEVLGPLVSRISSDLDCAVLIIEHNVQVLASVAHRLVAMRSGAVIAQGAPSAVLNDPAVRGAYFGAERSAADAPQPVSS